MTIITIDNVIPMLEKVVEGNEDKHYVPEQGTYKYAHRDAPGCIVGHVFYNELPELYSEIYAIENLPDGTSDALGSLGAWTFEHDVSDLFHVYKTLTSQEADAVLNAAQGAQDTGDSWEEALAEAKRTYELIKRTGELP